jgi:hypothetical protein
MDRAHRLGVLVFRYGVPCSTFVIAWFEKWTRPDSWEFFTLLLLLFVAYLAVLAALAECRRVANAISPTAYRPALGGRGSALCLLCFGFGTAITFFYGHAAGLWLGFAAATSVWVGLGCLLLEGASTALISVMKRGHVLADHPDGVGGLRPVVVAGLALAVPISFGSSALLLLLFQPLSPVNELTRPGLLVLAFVALACYFIVLPPLSVVRDLLDAALRERDQKEVELRAAVWASATRQLLNTTEWHNELNSSHVAVSTAIAMTSTWRRPRPLPFRAGALALALLPIIVQVVNLVRKPANSGLQQTPDSRSLGRRS